jgi:hypothetical protein
MAASWKQGMWMLPSLHKAQPFWIISTCSQSSPHDDRSQPISNSCSFLIPTCSSTSSGLILEMAIKNVNRKRR